MRDSLPEDLPGLRVVSFGYPAKLLSRTSRATIPDFARALLAALETKRTGTQRRPLIIIAHDIRGAVCKAALVMALADPCLKCIWVDTAGLMLLRTPQKWICQPFAIEMLSDMYTVIVSKPGAKSPKRKARASLVENLMPCAEDVRSYGNQYLLVSKDIPLISFCEAEETPPFRERLVSLLTALRRAVDMTNNL